MMAFPPRPFYWLVLACLLALTLGFYVRLGLIEVTPVGLACDAGEVSLRCMMRRGAEFGFNWAIFGLAALAASLWCLWRPGWWSFGIALVFGGLGLVLYNASLAGTAVTLALLSLARLPRD